jgi:hypothetical protein
MSRVHRRRGALFVAGALVASLFAVGVPVAADAATPTGTIKGVVTGAGKALAHGEVDLYTRSGSGASATWEWTDYVETSANGSYSFPALAAGTYTLQFMPTDGQNLVGEWWNDKSSEATATAIAVGTSTVTASADLAVGATISGKVSWPAGTTAQPYAVLLKPDKATGYDRWTATDNFLGAQASSNGTYKIVGVPAGTYSVAFFDSNYPSSLTATFYGDTDNITLAKSFSVAKASSTTAIDGALRKGATLSGTIKSATGTPIAYGTATAARKIMVDGKPYWESAELEADDTGKFSEQGLPAGTWAVKFSADGYTSGYYGGGSSYATATNFTLAAGGAKSGVDAALLKLLGKATPTISGSAAVGSKLTADHHTWTAGTTFTYQWYSNGVAIANAKASTFVVTSSQRGEALTVRVTGHKAGYTTAGVTSKATALVPTTSTPTISGVAKVGKKLTAGHGTWTTGTTFTYRWYAGGTAITGATAATYTLKSAQKGKVITVKVTGKKAGYTTVTKTSKATAKVG